MNKHNKDLEVTEFLALEQMTHDHLLGPDTYRASKHWEKLNDLNTQWLREDGLDNFKRTVNNNYFNWMVTPRSQYFQRMAKQFIRAIIQKPSKLLLIFSVNIEEMFRRTYALTTDRAGFLNRKVYALYLLFLFDFVKKNDKLELFAHLSEPAIGNPICIEVSGKKVSQDLSNSYMEYSFVREVLGNEFSKVKVLAEIGGGYGRLSYLFHRFHHHEGLKIIMIDLPPALYIAQWYLKNAFTDSPMMLYRDFSSFDEIKDDFEKASICFLLPHQLAMLPANLIDLLINVSSLHEMSRAQINHYYELIDEKCRIFYTKQYAFWENPDDKISVPAVIYPTRPSWDLMNARLNPVHAEFFEAIFRVKKS